MNLHVGRALVDSGFYFLRQVYCATGQIEADLCVVARNIAELQGKSLKKRPWRAADLLAYILQNNQIVRLGAEWTYSEVGAAFLSPLSREDVAVTSFFPDFIIGPRRAYPGMPRLRRGPHPSVLAVLLSAGLFLGLAQRPLLAQAADHDPEIHRLNGRYFAKMGIDFGKILVSPIHWKKTDFLWFGGAVAATGLSVAFLDHGTREWVEDHEDASINDFSLFVSHLGEVPFILGLSTVLYAGGEAFKDDGLRKTGLMSLESFCISGIVVNGMKYIVARARPLSGEGHSSLHWFSFKNNQHAFPSGHSASAFAVAAVIAGQSDSFLVGTASYGVASLVALSRVNNDEHWFSDIVAGSIIGYFIGKKVLSLNAPGGNNKPSVSFGPAPGGFSLSLRF